MEGEHKITIEVPFPSESIARVAYDVLRVDKEPKRGRVTKTFHVKGSVLQVFFSAELVKQLRVAVTGFYEKLDLIIGTVDLLGPPVSDTYDFY